MIRRVFLLLWIFLISIVMCHAVELTAGTKKIIVPAPYLPGHDVKVEAAKEDFVEFTLKVDENILTAAVKVSDATFQDFLIAKEIVSKGENIVHSEGGLRYFWTLVEQKNINPPYSITLTLVYHENTIYQIVTRMPAEYIPYTEYAEAFTKWTQDLTEPIIQTEEKPVIFSFDVKGTRLYVQPPEDFGAVRLHTDVERMSFTHTVFVGKKKKQKELRLGAFLDVIQDEITLEAFNLTVKEVYFPSPARGMTYILDQDDVVIGRWMTTQMIAYMGAIYRDDRCLLLTVVQKSLDRTLEGNTRKALVDWVNATRVLNNDPDIMSKETLPIKFLTVD